MVTSSPSAGLSGSPSASSLAMVVVGEQDPVGELLAQRGAPQSLAQASSLLMHARAAARAAAVRQVAAESRCEELEARVRELSDLCATSRRSASDSATRAAEVQRQLDELRWRVTIEGKYAGLSPPAAAAAGGGGAMSVGQSQQLPTRSIEDRGIDGSSISGAIVPAGTFPATSMQGIVRSGSAISPSRSAASAARLLPADLVGPQMMGPLELSLASSSRSAILSPASASTNGELHLPSSRLHSLQQIDRDTAIDLKRAILGLPLAGVAPGQRRTLMRSETGRRIAEDLNNAALRA